jgi:pilus assembly protein CpaF
VSALNTGHQGSMSTVHANSPEEALWRIETLAMYGDRRVSDVAVRRQLLSAVDLMIQVVRRGNQRQVCTIARVEADGVIEVASW